MLKVDRESVACLEWVYLYMALSDDNVLFSALQDLQGAFFVGLDRLFKEVIYMTKKTINEQEEKKMPLIRLDKVYESLRYNDYEAKNGIGEIVDNAQEAGANIIHVCITKERVKNGKKNCIKIKEVAVIDDGCGMNEELIGKCLALGETYRPPKPNGKLGIGKFGAGLTLGAISLARRVEVYSRNRGDADFLYSYVDLELIGDCQQVELPVPQKKSPKQEYGDLLKNASGTIVVLSNCDRINNDIEDLAYFLARTYRKFIEQGLKIYLSTKMDDESQYKAEQVFLHDPLYLAAPTKFDYENRKMGKLFDLKAKELDPCYIPLEIPGQPGKTADVVIRMSLLPEGWRRFRGDGGSPEAKKRHIPDNEGFSILRADREVLYGHVPFMTGTRGTARAQEIDRFWGCEISFPPELDDYFQVRYIKRGAEPVEALRDQIRDKLKDSINSARKEIKEFFNKNEEEKLKEQNAFEAAENAMASVTHNLPMGQNTQNLTQEETERKLNLAAQESLDTKRDDALEQRDAVQKKKEELKKKPFSVEPVLYPKSILFDTVHTPGSVIIKLNLNHPFYEMVMKPLCNIGDGDDAWAITAKNKRTWDAMLLLLFAYAKAETMFDSSNNALFEQLKSQWGAILGTAIDDIYRGGDGA